VGVPRQSRPLLAALAGRLALLAAGRGGLPWPVSGARS
jgi:hypothetical protein